MDLVNIKLRKIAVDVLEWNHEEARFILEGKLLFTQPTDNNWRKGRTIKLTPVNALLVINGKVRQICSSIFYFSLLLVRNIVSYRYISIGIYVVYRRKGNKK